MTKDEHFMLRCIQLAELGRGKVSPNPMVGSVIVYEDKIIGEGYHKEFGKEHAEVNAIKSVENKEVLSQCTIYVNLEPCAHYGKTPPCADLIIKHKFKKVVIGSKDIFAKVNGLGIEKLQNAGIEVGSGVLEKECLDLNARFFFFHSKKRPYIILKWAQTKDGFIGKSDVSKVKISNENSQILNHLWRSQEQAILVGVNTANFDNPSLNVRLVSGRNPSRFIIDLNNKLNKDVTLLNDSEQIYVFSLHPLSNNSNVNYLRIDDENNFFNEFISHLNQIGIQSIIIEGGAGTIQKFFDSKLWDEARVFQSSNELHSGIEAPKLKNQQLKSLTKVEGNSIDTLSIFIQSNQS